MVGGIRCNHCESNIKLELGKISGVKRVKISKRRVVTIEFEGTTYSDHEFETAIKSLGYKIID
jgi:copper chaperone CopZ